MKALWISSSVLCASLYLTASMADDAPGATPIQQMPAESAVQAPGEPAPAKFTTEAHWETAGYNNQEVVYTILINSQDSRIIHCSTELHGFYLENGQKVSISDRQNSTIFPGQQGKAGNWLGMDRDSGATYKVTCHPR
jgi:hypothetical protein